MVFSQYGQQAQLRLARPIYSLIYFLTSAASNRRSLCFEIDRGARRYSSHGVEAPSRIVGVRPSAGVEKISSGGEGSILPPGTKPRRSSGRAQPGRLRPRYALAGMEFQLRWLYFRRTRVRVLFLLLAGLDSQPDKN